jgi:hypothetical protein
MAETKSSGSSTGHYEYHTPFYLGGTDPYDIKKFETMTQMLEQAKKQHQDELILLIL